ncbi:hypothetical protein [Desulfoplanes formicivorans]|uniref:hypothetical protein n=1 Tax=Desulfoplanes formicivorans TaxID=1592317 RepID=UPI00159F3292|nr:hypothetical protein [Desulfoplanes formicivorans]
MARLLHSGEPGCRGPGIGVRQKTIARACRVRRTRDRGFLSLVFAWQTGFMVGAAVGW